MTENDEKKAHLENIRDQVRARQMRKNTSGAEAVNQAFTWSNISKENEQKSVKPLKARENRQYLPRGKNFNARTLRACDYEKENFENADFIGADLSEGNLKNANLKGADFSNADLSGADLSGADLEGAKFSGANLMHTNFSGANLKDVFFDCADLGDAFLLDMGMDDISIADLQEFVEFLAEYYPHKLDLTRLNLTLLDLSRINLKDLDLRGVDFTGCDFTGVNIYELDLSECIISPAQIEQAIGHKPTPEELKQILAPKKKKKKKRGIDLTEFFFPRGPVGVWDTTKYPSIRISDLMHAGKKLYRAFLGRQDTDEEIMEKFHNRHKKTSEEIWKEYETSKREELEEKLYQKHKEEYNKAFEQAKIKIHKEYVSSQKKGPTPSVKNAVRDAFLTEHTYMNGRGSRGR